MNELNFFHTFIRLMLAVVCGSVLGLERTKSGKSAGFRTHILVCVGSALIMLISIYIFQLYATTNASLDPSRIAAGVVTGIGFLGAGAIMKSEEHIIGLTTAASIWISSGIGLAVGCGYISAALVATIVAFLVLSVPRILNKNL